VKRDGNPPSRSANTSGRFWFDSEVLTARQLPLLPAHPRPTSTRFASAGTAFICWDLTDLTTVGLDTRWTISADRVHTIAEIRRPGASPRYSAPQPPPADSQRARRSRRLLGRLGASGRCSHPYATVQHPNNFGLSKDDLGSVWNGPRPGWRGAEARFFCNPMQYRQAKALIGRWKTKADRHDGSRRLGECKPKFGQVSGLR
jgi:hypothetical protein